MILWFYEFNAAKVSFKVALCIEKNTEMMILRTEMWNRKIEENYGCRLNFLNLSEVFLKKIKKFCFQIKRVIFATHFKPDFLIGFDMKSVPLGTKTYWKAFYLFWAD